MKSVSHIQVAESEEFVKVCLEADHPSQVPFEVALLSDDITAIGKYRPLVCCITS